MSQMTGSDHLAQVLDGYGVTHVFFVPAILLNTLAAMEKLPIRRVVTHGEKAAAYMADGYARVTGKPGICFAQNIGSSNLAAGLRDAKLAGVPLIAITGGPTHETRYKNYYQEIEDFSQFDPVTKLNMSVDHVSRLPDLLRQAFREATSGAPGPVHIRLPGVSGDDLMRHEASLPVLIEERYRQAPAFRPVADSNSIRFAIDKLIKAKRPLIIAGGGVVISNAEIELLSFAEKLNIPVATSLNAKGVILDNHPLSVGIPGTYSRKCANQSVSEADLIFFIGSKTGGQVTTKWKLPKLDTTIIHLDIETKEFGRNYPNTHPILADAKTGLTQMIQACEGINRPNRKVWLERIQLLVKNWWESEAVNLESNAIPMRPERVCYELSKALPPNAILVSDTGHSGMWSGVMVQFNQPGQRYIRCAGSLGWALPAAMGVKCAKPDHAVVCFAGDGAAYYHLAELETAVRYGINVIFVINNNNALNQEIALYDQAYRGKLEGNSEELWRFTEVNFANVAQALGCTAFRVEDPRKLQSTIQKALTIKKGPVVIETLTDVNSIAKGGWVPT